MSKNTKYRSPKIEGLKNMSKISSEEKQEMEVATLGGGCFWCTEAVFKRIKGVEKVESGYSGGKIENPSYEQVSTGTTGHAEVVQITFNPQVITYEEILEIFFTTHDPTTLTAKGQTLEHNIDQPYSTIHSNKNRLQKKQSNISIQKESGKHR